METDMKTAVSNRSKEREGEVATRIESQTAKIPSDVYLWASIASMIASFVLKMVKLDRTALFIGQWAPSFLILGLYNKLVKQVGHDRRS